MAIYEYYNTGDDGQQSFYDSDNYEGQSFTPLITHILTSIKVKLWRGANDPGTITGRILAVDDDGHPTGSALCTGTLIGSTITTDSDADWYTITMGSGTLVVAGTQYAITLYSSSATNPTRWRKDLSNPTYTRGTMLSYEGAAWYSISGSDMMFEEWGDAPTVSPTVTTQAVTAIVTTTATGNGNVTSLGDSPVTQHGHCWNTTGTPTTANSKTINGAKATTGAFTSAITGLTAGTKYYVRAYATNSAGTSYGNQVEFVADKGTVFPINPLLRASGIRRTFWSGLGGQAVYQCELALGGMTTTYVSPIGSREIPSAVTPTEAPEVGSQQADYQVWLNYYITYNISGLIKTFGHIPTYEEWVAWKQSPTLH